MGKRGLPEQKAWRFWVEQRFSAAFDGKKVGGFSR
jgi:hypothetical protein